ncbi:hypothetical protein ACT42U_18445 [Acinetobacter baumannii]|nr:hypothetical protein [Acinetobacter baumannii]
MKFSIDREKMNISFKKALVKINTDLDPDTLHGLLLLSRSYKNNFMIEAERKLKRIEKDLNLDIDEKDRLIEGLSEDVSMANEISVLGEELAIIGLYKTIEIAIKKACKLSGKFNDKEIYEMYITKKLIKNFNNIKIDIKMIDGFTSFEELKLLNNCLKHEGTISKDLFKINPKIGKEGEKIKNSAEHFNRLLHPSIKFLNELGVRLSLAM